MIARRNRFRLYIFIAVALFHVLLLFFVAFQMNSPPQEEEPEAQVIKLVDVQEIMPLPPPPEEEPQPADTSASDSVAETMIETDRNPDDVNNAPPPLQEETGYRSQNRVSSLPRFSEDRIKKATVYPSIALRASIEGMVYLELFVDAQGVIQQINVLKEDPAGRGFGEAAVAAFKGITAEKPAMANGRPVAVRYRYPVRFSIRR